jgi:DNA-binding Xre family transcriptional regulator
MGINHKIVEAMAEKGFNTESLAEALNVSRQTVHRYRHAKDLKWSTVERICDGLGITIEELCRY